MKDTGKYGYGYCIGCGTDISIIDADPNGDQNATCVKCRAEEEHDFDVEPLVTFSRSGDRIEPLARVSAEAETP